ncbi:MAG: hypothetical protein GXP46_00035 [Deferribacteres bacterium]|nr:hypothetical protein [Deferribacteres bacterium]
MKKAKKLAALLIACVIVAFGFGPAAYAVDNEALTKMIKAYNEEMERYADALLSKNWKDVEKSARNLLKKSQELDNIGKKERNKDWLNESNQLVTHSKELIYFAGEKDAIESFFTAAGLHMHFRLFQAANPSLLIDHISEGIEGLSKSIEEKDSKDAIESAEHINIGAGIIALSGLTVKRKFANTRWVKDAYKMSMAGDEIQEFIREGNWAGVKKLLEQIMKTHRKIKSSLKG